MKKYRIVEKNGKFYPQFRRGGWLSNFWWPIMGKVNPNDPMDSGGTPKQIHQGSYPYTLFIEYARDRIDRHSSNIRKQEAPSIIHQYEPKK